MKNLPFGRPGNFYRGNLHTHCTDSDGSFPAELVIKKYKDAGYDFLGLSDHFIENYDYPVTDTRSMQSDDFTTLISAELHVGTIKNGTGWHILANGLPLDFEKTLKGETAPEIAQRAADAGAFVTIVHPSWYGLTHEDARQISCAHATEIYNFGADIEMDRGIDWPFLEALLEEGWRLNGIATDDAHLMTHDCFGGWIQVHAESLDPDALLDSLKAGRFYSSQGPEIHDIRIEGDMVHIKCSPAISISAVGLGSLSSSQMGEDMTELVLPIKRFKDGYFRVTVIDKNRLKAWSNPIWLK